MSTNNSIDNKVTSGNFTVTNGNILLPTTSSTVGQIQINSARWAHAYGTNCTAVGTNAGNFNANTQCISVGDSAGYSISSNTGCTMVGYYAGNSNTSDHLTAVGWNAAAVGVGGEVTAIGCGAHQACTGNNNLAVGYNALGGAGGNSRCTVALGTYALQAATGGESNCMVGYGAGFNLDTGSYNTCLGTIDHYGGAGSALTGSDSSNVLIHSKGVAGDSNTIRIGISGSDNSQQNRCFIAAIYGVTVTGSALLINSSGQLGTISSSIRYKENVTDMADSSNIVHQLRPVTFNYKKDTTKAQKFGLIAEEVINVAPHLVVFDQDGKPDAVAYHELPALLLNEIQKLTKRIEVLEAQLKKGS